MGQSFLQKYRNFLLSLYLLKKKMLKLLKSIVLLVVSVALAMVLLPLGILWTTVEIGIRFLFPH
nr:MAG TPA: alpha-hemoglobin stabilizing protein [Caudoviricetes sp.]